MRRNIITAISIAFSIIVLASPVRAFDPSGLLEIRYINVGWGSSILVIGPDGTTILMDGGSDGKGNSRIIPYLQSIGLTPSDDLDYMIASHQHSDHIGGLDEVIYGGYDVLNAVYYNGSNYSNSYVTAFRNAAATTTAGPIRIFPLGSSIQLGDSATATCVCQDGTVIGHGLVPGSRTDENDRSLAILIKYKNFEYLFAGDMGGGNTDQSCTGRSTSQANVETPLAQAITPGGEFPLLTSNGVEVLHVNHHASESSTNSDYMNLLKPAVACISVGAGQSPDYMFPRHDVVDNVLRAEAYCITADPAIVLQNEEGYPAGSLTSYSGYCVGNIIIKTAGVSTFIIDGDGAVTEGPDERAALGMPRTIPLDGTTGDTIPPAVTVNSPNGSEQWLVGSQHPILWTATDAGGVAQYGVEYTTNSGSNWLSLRTFGPGNPGIFNWTIPSTPSVNCKVRVTCADSSGNSTNDISDAAFTIYASQDTAYPVVNVVFPNGGEILSPGDIDTIMWTATDDAGVDSYALSYTINGGSSWITIISRTAGNPQVYAWTIPSVNSANCKVRVMVWDTAQHISLDVSNAVFSITPVDHRPPLVNISSPNGGESFFVGGNHSINWTATDSVGVDSISIQYSIDNGASWTIIQPFTHSNPGSYSWNVPETPSRVALIRISAKDPSGNIGTDNSNSTFYIRKSREDIKEMKTIHPAR